jgi:glycosyltransferase involved in cell wall biosynthesis
VAVVPPFTTIANFGLAVPADPEPPFWILFVGRLAPNKGHFDLLHVIAAYVATISPAIKLTIVGASDDNLAPYREDVLTWIERLGLKDKVDIRDKVDAATLHRLFREASAFLCMSEHEGFCVPVVEAQLTGLPVVSVGSTALKDTIGPGQLVVDPPQVTADYIYIARLLHAVCTDPALRRQVVATGRRNVLTRFAPSAVADSFVGALAPILEGLV